MLKTISINGRKIGPGERPYIIAELSCNHNGDIEKAFRIILKDPNVKAILVNIFGGIVRCDRVAQGIVDAYKNMGTIPVPLIVRLQGTNAEEGAKIIRESGLKVFSAILLKEAAQKIKEVLA